MVDVLTDMVVSFMRLARVMVNKAPWPGARFSLPTSSIKFDRSGKRARNSWVEETRVHVS